MTIGFGEQAAMPVAAAAPIRRVLLAPFGWYTRQRLRAYAQSCLIVAGALGTIGIGIDLPPRLSQVLAHDPHATGLHAVLLVGWYVLLRLADIMTELWPIACCLGMLWAEVAHTWSRERLVVWNSGRSPAQCLAPVVLFGLAAGGVQLALDTYLRPAAVMTQVETKLGDYGRRFDRSPTKAPVWLAAGRDVVRARLIYGPPAALEEVTLYRLDAAGRLVAVMTARSATPGSPPGTWLLHHGTEWAAQRDPATTDAALLRALPPSPAGAVQDFTARAIALRLDPLWLSMHGIQPQYLPQSVLMALARSSGDLYEASPYRAWSQVRLGRGLFAFGMVLLASSLALMLLAYRTRFAAVMAVAATGYVAHVLMKVLIITGEYGYVPPLLAGWLMPALLIGAAVALLTRLERQQRIGNVG